MAYPQSDPCGCSSSSADTAAPFSCPSCSGSHIEASPAAPPAPPGTPWRPAWRCAPCLRQRDTGAWSGNVSCTGCSGCTVPRHGRSPRVPSTQGNPAPSHTHTHLENNTNKIRVRLYYLFKKRKKEKREWWPRSLVLAHRARTGVARVRINTGCFPLPQDFKEKSLDLLRRCKTQSH